MPQSSNFEITVQSERGATYHAVGGRTDMLLGGRIGKLSHTMSSKGGLMGALLVLTATLIVVLGYTISNGSTRTGNEQVVDGFESLLGMECDVLRETYYVHMGGSDNIDVDDNEPLVVTGCTCTNGHISAVEPNIEEHLWDSASDLVQEGFVYSKERDGKIYCIDESLKGSAAGERKISELW